jgi:hypothetical protein
MTCYGAGESNAAVKESLSISSEDVRSYDNMAEGLSRPLLLWILENDELSRPSAQHDARIDASETEAVRYRMRDRHVPGFATD